jgi:hypothetical protein
MRLINNNNNNRVVILPREEEEEEEENGCGRGAFLLFLGVFVLLK